jgi:MFS transporter, ACDE family, multidrug resistance protein
MRRNLNAKTKEPGIAAMIILACVPLLMVLGNAVLIPVLPDLESRLHVTKVQVSLLITLFSVPAGIAIPIFGMISDSIPRKWIIFPSLLLFGIGGVGAGAATLWLKHPYPWILASRIVQGIGASGTAPIAMAAVADLFSGSARSRALGINEAGNAFGKVISPILGSLVAYLFWGAVFFIFPVLCVPLAIAIIFLIPKTQSKSKFSSVRKYLSAVKQVFVDKGKRLAVFYIFGGVALFTLFGTLVYLSDLLETKYGIGGLRRGLIIAIPLSVLTITALLTGFFTRSEQKRMKWFVLVGFSVVTSSFIADSFVGNRPWLLTALLCGSALGAGCVLPCLNTSITSLVEQEQRGLVTSFYGSVRFLGVAAGPPVFTWLVGISPTLMFWSIAVLSGICVILSALTVRQPDDEHPGGVNNTLNRTHKRTMKKAGTI